MSIKKFFINEKEEIYKIIDQADACYVSMTDLEGNPYCVPMNFGFKNEIFYFHSGKGGKKMEIFQKNPKVCIVLDIDRELNVRHEGVACSYSMKYQSVMAYGNIEIIKDLDEKREYMNIIMKHYTSRDDFKYNDPAIKNVEIMRVKCDYLAGHNRGY